MRWIDTPTKTDQKTLLVNLNLDLNKSWILAENQNIN
jgi:hypothetical protein